MNNLVICLEGKSEIRGYVAMLCFRKFMERRQICQFFSNADIGESASSSPYLVIFFPQSTQDEHKFLLTTTFPAELSRAFKNHLVEKPQNYYVYT